MSFEYKVVDPTEVGPREFYRYMLSVVAPRPIAFASTINKKGEVNLSPFSYFNSFSSNPPILIFSPARRGRDNTMKDTYNNVMEVEEVVINMVDFTMVEQMSLASTEFASDVNEFVKAGLTEVPSERVTPPRVGESPASFECRVIEIKSLGTGGGAGNLIICEVLLGHFSPRIFDQLGQVDPHRLDAVGRLGANWYCRANGDALFEIKRPFYKEGIGIDQLPESLRMSNVLTGNELARLANVEKIPEKTALDDSLKDLIKSVDLSDREASHEILRHLLRSGKVDEAWQCYLHFEDH